MIKANFSDDGIKRQLQCRSRAFQQAIEAKSRGADKIIMSFDDAVSIDVISGVFGESLLSASDQRKRPLLFLGLPVAIYGAPWQEERESIVPKIKKPA